MAPTRDDVLQAAERILGRVHRTPTFSSQTLGAYLKAELFQKTGSFKARGVLNKLTSLSREEKERGVIGISAGNHAQALAWGAALEGIDCLVVMYASASAAKVAATRGYGASVDLEAGIAAAVPDRKVIAVEPEGSRAVHDALEAGGPVPVTPESIADGLSAPLARENALAVLREQGVESVLVTEAEIEEAFRFLYERAKLACEPAGAVGVAAILAGKVEAKRTAAVVSGGNVATQTASAILA